MIFIFSAVFILLVLGIVFLISNNIFSKKSEDISVSEPLLSEEPENVLPTITGQGAEPFILGQSIMNIPPKGKFYDTILLSKHYGVIEGDHYLVIDENEIDDYYKTMGSDYFDPDIIGTATVLYKGDTLMNISYNESGTIDNIEILSSKLQLDNGIHVGLSSSEMFSKHHADFLTTDCFAGESLQIYYVPDLPENITLFATMNSVDGATWYAEHIHTYDGYDPDRTIYQCVKEENGSSALYKVPFNYVRDCSIKKIDITPNGLEGFKLK